jgi:hypothetical protein
VREVRKPERSHLLVLTIAGASLVQVSDAAVYGFSTLYWQSFGISGGDMGYPWAAGIASEIAFFSLFGYVVHGVPGAAALLAPVAPRAPLDRNAAVSASGGTFNREWPAPLLDVLAGQGLLSAPIPSDRAPTSAAQTLPSNRSSFSI